MLLLVILSISFLDAAIGALFSDVHDSLGRNPPSAQLQNDHQPLHNQ